MAEVKPHNKPRFAWWAAEEASTSASNFYVTDLIEKDEARPRSRCTSTSTWSARPTTACSSTTATAPIGAEGPRAPTTSRRCSSATTPTATSRPSRRRSTAAPTTSTSSVNGVPAGGLFTGAEAIKTAAQAEKWAEAGVAFDPCYHQACDTIDNLSYRALRINSDAMAYVTFLYATGKEVITTD